MFDVQEEIKNPKGMSTKKKNACLVQLELERLALYGVHLDQVIEKQNKAVRAGNIYNMIISTLFMIQTAAVLTIFYLLLG